MSFRCFPALALGAVLLSASLAGCASTGGTGGAATADAAAADREPTRRRADLLTTDEIRSSPYRNLLEVIRATHPLWLRQRGVGSIRRGEGEAVKVYVNGVRGGPRDLAILDKNSVVQVQYLNGPEATARWGVGHPNGAISVTTGAQN